jgi:hypothetical protein
MRCIMICLAALSMAGCATTGAAETAKAGCCGQAKAKGDACGGCATKQAKTDCCAQAKAEGKACEACATKKASPEESTL